MTGRKMRTCEAIFGPEQARNIEDLVVSATGLSCPCMRHLPCPLADDLGRNPLAEVFPRQRGKHEAVVSPQFLAVAGM
jgi:hypothetical protein